MKRSEPSQEINLRASLAENGVFVTDNRFETDLGERPQQPRKDAPATKPIFEPSFFEMPPTLPPSLAATS